MENPKNIQYMGIWNKHLPPSTMTNFARILWRTLPGHLYFKVAVLIHDLVHLELQLDTAPKIRIDH